MKKLFSRTTAILIMSLFLCSNAFALAVEWQTIDWKAWGRLYDGTGTSINSNPYDPLVNNPTQQLTAGYHSPDGTEDSFGITQILNIKNSASPYDILWEKSTDKELTIFFWGADDVQLDVYVSSPSVFARLLTLGFRAEVWLDTTPDYTTAMAQGPAARNDNTDPTHFQGVTDDGTMVLSLAGHTQYDNNNAYEAEEFGNPVTGAFNGSVLLDVTGGIWSAYYDTDTFFANDSTTADMTLSFSTLPDGSTGSNAWKISGNATALVNIVPEPATMLLLGFGLIGIAGIGRKKTA